MSEYYGIATTPMDDYLAHYGVKGMKWGVRRALASGNSARLGRQYAKAQKKLAKLEKRAAKAETYGKRAKRLAAGAAVAGGLAVAGTSNIAKGMKGVAKGVDAVGKFAGKHGVKIRGITDSTRHGLRAGANAVDTFGKGTGASSAVRNLLDSDAVQNLGRSYHGVGGQMVRGAGAAVGRGATAASKALKGVSNNTLARIGAGVIGAGLAAGAAKNAHRAKTAQKKAAQFRSEMNKAFAGTKYANGGSSTSGKKRRRSNRG